VPDRGLRNWTNFVISLLIVRTVTAGQNGEVDEGDAPLGFAPRATRGRTCQRQRPTGLSPRCEPRLCRQG
jgi:hypothetical protein